MTLISQFPIRALSLGAMLLLTACNSADLDWDLRSNGLDTTSAAEGAASARPQADGRGVISYPTYQVAVAREGDTVATVADRVGLAAGELASYNALQATAPLRAGELLALPTRVAAAPATSGGIAPAVDVASIATTALNRVDGAPVTGNTIGATTIGTNTLGTTAASAPTGNEPLQHQVKRGETAFTIARTYNVSAKSLADWNSLGADLAVREGQFLMIPTGPGVAAQPQAVETEANVTAPGIGSATPEPPSASAPLPDEETLPAAEATAAATKATPESPALADTRSAASGTKFAMPVDGKIIRPYEKKKNDGIDIAAPAGTAVKAAAAGTVAAITKDTTGTPIIVIRHDGGILTVYAGVDAPSVAKGDAVSKGQTIAKVKSGDPAFLHFEVRQGVDSVDPMGYL